jgi:toxic protein SymE
MADANLKPRSSRQRTHACVTLRDSPDYGSNQQDGPSTPFMPWMQIADVWLRQAGFTPGRRMHIAFDCRNASLTITPDCG